MIDPSFFKWLFIGLIFVFLITASFIKFFRKEKNIICDLCNHGMGHHEHGECFHKTLKGKRDCKCIRGEL